MKLNLEKPVVFFDIESTGLDIANNSIIELCFVKVFPDGERREKTWRVCPWDYVNNIQRPNEEGAFKVHNISDSELKDEPKFFEIADEVVSWLEDAELGGYNSQKFDLPMLAEEIERVKAYKHKSYNLDLHQKKMIDVQLIYFAYEPRNLSAAHRFYCGESFENAHSASSDVIATVDVLEAQLDKYKEVSKETGYPALKNDINNLSSFVKTKFVDFAGRLVRNDKGEIEVNFGKHKGKTARQVYKEDPSYFAWIDKGEFMLDTKRQFTELKAKFDEENKQQKIKEDSLSKKPLDSEQLKDAEKLLQGAWTGKLF